MLSVKVMNYLPAVDHQGEPTSKLVKEIRLFGWLLWKKEVIVPANQANDMQREKFFTSI